MMENELKQKNLQCEKWFTSMASFWMDKFCESSCECI